MKVIGFIRISMMSVAGAWGDPVTFGGVLEGADYLSWHLPLTRRYAWPDQSGGALPDEKGRLPDLCSSARCCR